MFHFMWKNKNQNSVLGIIDRFEFPDNRSFLNLLSKYQQKKMPREIKNFERQLKNYPNIFKKDNRPSKALAGLKLFSWFLYPQGAKFKLETALEGLVLIFLLDEIADNNHYPLLYRKNFLKEFAEFIKNISLKSKITAKDLRQKEMQEIWLNHFNKIYCRPSLKQEKWIKASQDFVQGMKNELNNKKYKTLENYLKNAIPSSGALFYWQSIITEAGQARLNNARYDKLPWQVGKILRLTNDFAQIKEDKKKITALNFYGKKELKDVIKKELIKFQRMLKKSAVNKKIRFALWRSAIFLYYFYQKRNF